MTESVPVPPTSADWYGMGREAFMAGLPLDMCPRSEGEAASRSWVEGWHAADFEQHASRVSLKVCGKAMPSCWPMLGHPRRSRRQKAGASPIRFPADG